MNPNHYFLKTINHLLQGEELILYNRLIPISKEEEKMVAEVLRKQYEMESLEYPHKAPDFNEEAALWAARVLYLTAQLLLYREMPPESLEEVFPKDTIELDASAILSVDVSLRYLPKLLTEAKFIDFEDQLIPIIQAYLYKWHYSAVGYALENEKLDFTPILNNDCVKQLYADRIIEHKVRTLAEHPAIKEQVKGSMGNYASYYWKDL